MLRARSRDRARHPPRQRASSRISLSFAKLPPEVRGSRARRRLLNLTKANSRATVHRPAYLDYVGVKRFDEHGEVTCGAPLPRPLHPHRLQREPVGDPGAAAARCSACSSARACCPAATTTRRWSRSSRRTRATSCSRSRRTSCSRSRSASSTSASAAACGSSSAATCSAASSPASSTSRASGSTPRTGAGSRRSCRTRSRGVSVDYTTRISESVLARLHYVVYTEPGSVPDYDVAEIEARLAAATRAWTDDLRDALVDQLGEERAGAAARALRRGVPRRLPRGLHRAPGGARHRADRAARPRRTTSA